MPNHTQTNPSLTDDLSALYQRVAELETALAQSQQALAASQEVATHCLTLINHARDAIISLDEQQRITLFNPAAEHMFGYTTAEALGQSLDILFPPGVAELHRQHVADFLASPDQARPMGSEWRVISGQHRDGRIFTVDATLTKFKQAEQTTSTVYLHDITERRQNETLLRLQYEVSLAFSAADNLTMALPLLLETITKIDGIDCGGVYLVDEATGALQVVAHRGLSAEFVAQVAHYEAATPSAQLVQAGKPIYQNYTNFPLSHDPVRQREGLRAIGIIPIAYEGRVIAALNASSHTHDQIALPTRHALEMLALQLGGLLARMQAETSLQTSRENLQALFDTMDEFVFILDLQGSILTYNQVVQQRLGYATHELVGRSIVRVHPPEREAEAVGIVVDMLAGQGNTCFIPLITTTGTLIPVETKVTRGIWNNQPALFGVSRDITERLQAEARVRESEETARALINASPDVIALLDTQGAILTLNEAVARRMGQNPAELVGKNVFELLPPEVAQLRKIFFDQVRQTGQPVHFEDENRGAFFDNDVYPVIDPSGAVTRFAVYAHDTTARRRMQEALRASEASFRLLFADNPHPMWVYDRQTMEFLEVNDAAVAHFGYSRAEFLRMRGPDIRPPEEAARFMEHLRQPLPAMRASGHWQYRLKDGRVIVCDIHSHNLIFAGREAALVVAQDITERLQAETKLRESEETARALINASPDVVVLLDPQGTILALNEVLARRFGQPLAEVVGRNIYEILPPEVAQARKKFFDQAVQTGQPIQFEDENRGVFFESYVYPVLDSTGAVMRLAVYGHNITEHRRMQESLRASETSFRLLFANNPHPMWVYDRQTLAFLEINEAAIDHYGYSRAEFLRMNALDIRTPEEGARLKEYMRRSHPDLRRAGHWQHRLKDGRFIEVEINSHVINFAGREAVLVVSQDITARLQAEAQLRESEERFRQLAENIAEVFWITDSLSPIVYISPAYESVWGRTCQSLYEQPSTFIEAVHPEDRPQFDRVMNHQYEGQRTELEYRVVQPDGSIRWVWDRGFPIFDDNGQVVRVAGVAIDITERKEAEAQLRESEERFRQLAENIDQVFWMFEVNELVYISPAYEAVWGRTCQSLYENSFSFMESIHPDDQARLNQAIEQQLRGQRTEVEYRVVRPDGSMRWVVDRGFPIFDERGRVYRIAGIAADLTTRRQAELALQQRTQEYETLVENIPDIIHRLDRSLRVIYSNSAPTKSLGVPLDEVIGKTYREGSLSAETVDLLEGTTRRVFDTGQPEVITVKFDSRTGSAVYHQIHFVPEFGVDGVVETVLAIGRDVTELKQAQAAVEGLNRTLEARVEERTAALQESEARYRLLALNASDMIALHDLDTTIRYVSPSVKDILGYEPEALIGVMPMVLLHPDDAKRLEEDIRTYLATGQMISNLAYRLRHADGNYVWIETHSRHIINDAGHIVQLQSSSRDVTARKQMEMQLQQSEEKYRIVADYTTNWEYWRAPAGQFVYMSPSCQLITGYTVEEFQASPDLLDQIIHPDDQAMMQAHHHETGSTESVAQPDLLEFRIITKEGHVRWLEHQCRSIVAPDGRRLGKRASNRDITPRKQAEAALRASEARYRLLADSSQDIVALHTLNGLIEYISPSSRWLLGYEPQELLGQSSYSLTHPDDLAMMQGGIRQQIATGVMDQTLEFRLQHKAGHYLWQETKFRLIFDEAGEITQIRTTSRDITERKQAEELVRASEQRFREIFELSPVGIFISTVEGGIIRANAALCTMLGYTHEELQAKMLIELVHPADLAMEEMIFETKLLQGETAYYEQRYLAKSGEVIWANVAGKIIFGETGHLQYGLGIVSNITGRKDMEEALRLTANELGLANAELARAARLKDEFLASMSHELRTPLTAILGQSEVLQEEIYGPLTTEQRQALTDVQTSGQHLLTLINDLLDLSKIEAGKLELELRPVSVAGVCQASLRLIKNQAQKKELTVTFSQDAEVQVIQADERRLKQILVNLLSNAVKFTPAKGSIGLEVGADPQHSEVYFTVWDTGIGVAPENMERLFKPFVQLDSRLSRQYAGTGLGLSLVARLSEMHGGRVNLQSEVGQGSRFTVTLPWSGVTPKETVEEKEVKTGGDRDKTLPVKQTGTGVILVAEDNEQVLQVLVQYLQVGGYRTVVARNGHEALIKLAQVHPDLILMDVQMPGIDGLETIRRLRTEADSGLARTPIIALTALVTPEDRERCLAAGANAFLPKPVRLKELIGTIASLLSSAAPKERQD